MIEPETDAPLPMGDENKEVTEEISDQSDEKRDAALAATREGEKKTFFKIKIRT